MKRHPRTSFSGSAWEMRHEHFAASGSWAPGLCYACIIDWVGRDIPSVSFGCGINEFSTAYFRFCF